MEYKRIGKRLFDLTAALAAFLLLSPIFFLVVLLLFFANSGKVFFVQQRPGEKEQLFKIIKFRTMNEKKDAYGTLLPDADRLTRVGSLIRQLSLDELPQLINVIKGDMSLVGPRPLLIEYLSLYNVEQARRHEVKPGVTGWAQVNGRNAISWQKKFEFDIFYVENVSLKLDLRILFMTAKKVFLREGISSDTAVTVEKFKGN